MDPNPPQELLSNDGIIELKDFERQQKFSILNGPWKYYMIMRIANGEKSIAKVSKSSFDKLSQIKAISFYREVDILLKINHPSISKCLGYSLTNFKSKPNPVVIMKLPYMNAIKITDTQDTQKIIFLFGIASAMAYLHSHNILYRNLNLENITLDQFNYPKIKNFENSIEIQCSSEKLKDSRLRGEIQYLAPEVLKDLEYSKSSDVYSFGILMYEILCEDSYSISGSEKTFISNVIEKGKRPLFSELDEESINSAYRNLIKRCWSQKPEKRPTFEEIVKELKTNPEFITNKVNKDEYYGYVKMIEESPKTFNSKRTNKKLYEALKSKLDSIQRPKIDIKLRGPNYDGNEVLDLSKYKIQHKDIPDTNDYDLFRIIVLNKDREIEEKLYAQVYFKEINKFNRHEIVNLYSKLSILSQINHPAILNFIGFSPVDFDGKPRPIIVTEYDDPLSLNIKYSELFSNDDIISIEWNETKRLICIFGIASAMSYLHSHDIIHRDLKLESIHLDGYLYPKISNFDIAEFISDEMNDKIKGTPVYLAPEVYEKKEYSKSSDVYAFSFIMYELFTGKRAFKKFINPSEIKREIVEHQTRPTFYKRPIKKVYRELIERCWSQDPKSRPTFDEIVHELKTNSDFLTEGIDKEEYYQYIKFIDEFPVTFDPNKRNKYYDNVIQSNLHTFTELDPYLNLHNMYETETNDLSFDYNFFDLSNYEIEFGNSFENGSIYSILEMKHKEKDESIIEKTINWNIRQKSYSEIKNFIREMTILQQLNHPAIIKFIGFTTKDIRLGFTKIIVEIASNKSLDLFLKMSKKKKKKSIFSFHSFSLCCEKKEVLEWNDTKRLICIFGIASAMSYLHSHDIVHRDLKLENIYIDDKLHPKLSGFNISKFITNKTSEISNKIKGTPVYLAPEIYEKKEYSKSSDVYAFSFIMYELFTGKRAFEQFINPSEIKREIVEHQTRPTFNDKSIEKVYRELIERCWSQDPKSRPTFDEIVHELKTNSDFLTEGIDKEEYYQYIKFIDEFPVTFNDTKKVIPYDFDILTQKFTFQEEGSIINIGDIYKTEYNNIIFDIDFVNINNYKKQKLIRATQEFKMYEIINEKKENFFAIRITDYILNSVQELLIKEIKNNFKINHPSFLNVIGFSPFSFKNKQIPTFITEYASNGSLENILELDMNNSSNLLLNETKRLIIIYGIASGMSYLHSLDFVHTNLKPLNIFLDDFLYPKILGCNHSIEKIEKQNSFNIINSNNQYKEDIYISPEKQLHYIESKAGDVYSFSMIVYELITNEKPLVTYDIIKQICFENYRPKFKENTPECYKKLIEKCWSDDPKERPTFDEIVYHLKTNQEFINERINKEEFQSYIEFQSTQNNSQFEDFIKSKNGIFRKVKIDFNKIRNPARLNFSVNIGSINLNKFEKQVKIGSGGFGVVYKVCEKETEKIYAAKISIYEIDQCENDTIINLSREINIISQLNHPSILQYIGFSPYNFNNKPKPVIITEFASNGSLEDLIEAERNGIGHYEWNDTKKLINIYGIASGMAYLHNNNIIHRDLKPGNILIDDFLYPKIADFGLSKIISEQDNAESERKKPISSGFKGTFAYCAPEIMKRHAYTKFGDVFAFGMIVYEIITNETLYEGFNQFQLICKVMKGYRPKFKYAIPYSYRKLIEKCWDSDYKKRPSFDKIVQILETDKDFITQNVDEEEYLDYISFIKEHETQNVNHSNNIQSKVSFELKNKEEENNYFNDKIFLDLSKFERLDIIKKGDFYKTYKFKEIETGILYLGQMSMQTIKNISKEEILQITRELEIIKELKHPSLLKFIGYSPIDFKNNRKPVIVTEYASNGSLENILQIERLNKSIQGWDDTKKLINIFGISSCMLYLHSKNIIHRSLKPENIYLDDFLTPKIGDFGLSTRFINSKSITVQSISGVKASPIYSAPEILKSNEYSKASDVYAFSLIVFEIITNEIPFVEIIHNNNNILNEIVNNKVRPKINENVPESYRKLIEDCWAQNPNERPSFADIVYRLKIDNGFITEKVKFEDYQTYMNLLDIEINDRLTSQKITEIEENNNNNCLGIDDNYIEQAEKGNVKALEYLAKKYSIENDTENTYRYFCKLIELGKSDIALEYAVNLFKSKYYSQAFNYFQLISKSNHPIAKYYLAVMLFYGLGCNKNLCESFEILKYLSDNGIDRASEFIEDHFNDIYT